MVNFDDVMNTGEGFFGLQCPLILSLSLCIFDIAKLLTSEAPAIAFGQEIPLTRINESRIRDA